MKLMIDIPEKDYIRLRDEGMFGNVTTFKRAVRKGIPLEQEPCDDCISRQAVQTELENCEVVDMRDENDDLVGYYNADTVDSIVRNLPPVTAEKVGQWIPVSERYPEDGQRVLVDYCDEDAGIMLVRFHANGYRGFKAWMPLPERYEASPTGAESEGMG